MYKTRLEILKSKVVNVLDTTYNTVGYSRCELLIWLNTLLKSEFESVEELRTGAAYCQCIDMMFPGALPLKRVKFKPNLEHEFISNFKILETAFKNLGIQKTIPITVLVKGGQTDNFKFLQWFRKFFDANNDGKKYNAVEARGGVTMGYKRNGPKRACVMNGTVAPPISTRSSMFPTKKFHADGTVSISVCPETPSAATTSITTLRLSEYNEEGQKIEDSSEGKETANQNGSADEDAKETIVDSPLGASSSTEYDIYGAATQEQRILMDFLKCKTEHVTKKIHAAEQKKELGLSTLQRIEELCRIEEKNHGRGRCVEYIYKILYKSEDDSEILAENDIDTKDENTEQQEAAADAEPDVIAPNEDNSNEIDDEKTPRNEVAVEDIVCSASTDIVETSEIVEVISCPKIALDISTSTVSVAVENFDNVSKTDNADYGKDNKKSEHIKNADESLHVIKGIDGYDEKHNPLNNNIDDTGDAAAIGQEPLNIDNYKPDGAAKQEDSYHEEEKGRPDGDKL